jgi:Bacterial SH3 domain
MPRTAFGLTEAQVPRPPTARFVPGSAAHTVMPRGKRMRTSANIAIALAALLCLAPAASVLAETMTQQVSFPAGSDGATLTGTIRGDEAVRYILDARAGQRMIVGMTTTNASAYFNITAPGATEALHIGSVAGNSFDGILPAGGSYAIEVYLMRNAARRNETAEFSVAFQITGAGADNTVQPDFADSLMGGPDFWAVTGLSQGDRLSLRAGPSTGDRVIGRLAEGEVVRNLGCRMTGTQRWCQVETTRGSGWVSGRYLRESGTP